MHANYSMLTGFVLASTAAIVLPRLMERVKLPAVLGYIVAGILLGPAGFGVIQKDSPVITWLSEIGKLLFMFFVGFEIDLALLNKNKSRALAFGFFTFTIPLTGGLLMGRMLGYSWTAALLVGAIVASHTLLAYPVLQRLGVLGNRAVVATIGGTIFTDIAAMLVLAVAIAVHKTGFSWSFLGLEVLELAVFVPLLLFGLSKIVRKALIRFGREPETRVIIVMIAIALAAEGAHLIQLEGIVGAFLAGIALKRTLRGKFAIEQLEVLAHALFIPSFFLVTGFLVDFAVLKQSVLQNPAVVSSLIAVTIGGKWLAAHLTGRCFGFQTSETRTMASLSIPQMAATLASAVVGYQALNAGGERLLNSGFVNAVIVLVIVTCVLGPILTTRFAAQLPRADT